MQSVIQEFFCTKFIFHLAFTMAMGDEGNKRKKNAAWNPLLKYPSRTVLYMKPHLDMRQIRMQVYIWTDLCLILPAFFPMSQFRDPSAA